MTLLKSMSSLSFNASSFSNGSVSSGSMSSFGQSANRSSGIVAQLGSDLQPLVDGAIKTVNGALGTTIAFADGLISKTVGL
ncbi:hypothetical protein SAMD00019534_089460 [Acytostelium subglobosum LB1]|uniref:hypothetical protein n=1 Tax=Acytostelium subglobosum LB1 TaxID=1410327 RepID=UPI00064508A6|nr:hypothetical protein SAMD00019534_089460 [Acytostelium subglobosum LB1]GAM25771.1 hypothetical protein SAMD00019534_089460 [Acytostelium subglobosum LB1]|eukprot:XP_012751289.1 hypothetical protein SAMD00019534_089460 [Acytostelium subglobosum LB1]